ncbi:MAG: hypothetical protein ACI4C1_10060 [Lachnospiraceae bacterium]
MQDKYFNFGLYREALRQCRLIGIMAAIFMSLEAILVPMAVHISNKVSTTWEVHEAVTLVGKEDSALMVMPLLIAMILLVAPIMTLYLFRFENNRAASDCYHAMPQTRTCRFISFHAAIFTWMAGIIALNDVLFLGFVLISSEVSAAAAPVLMTSIAALAGCFLVQGGVALAMSVTGTTFSNLLVGIMVIFVPRGLYFVAIFIIKSIIPFLPYSALLTDSWLNIPVNLLFGLIEADSWGDGFQSWLAVGYTTLIGILYFVAAWFMNQKRKSESATHSASSHHIQTIFRMIPAFCVSLVGVYYIWYIVFEEDADFDSMDIFWLALIVIMALVTYMLYELMTTRQWKRVLRALPKFLWIFVLDIIFYAGCVIGMNVISSHTVNENEVKGFCFKDADNFYYYSERDWYKMQAQDVVIHDEQMIQLMVNRLNEQIEAFQQKNYDEIYYYHIEADGYEKESYDRYTIEFQTAHGSLVREINLTSQEEQLLEAALGNDDTYREIYMTLPSMESIQAVWGFGYLDLDLSNDRNLFESYYEALQQEIQEGGFEKWYQMLQNERDSFDRINLSLVMGGKSYEVNLPVSWDYPVSSERYIKMLLETEDNKNNIARFVEMAEEVEKSDYCYVGLTWYGERNQIWQGEDMYQEYLKDQENFSESKNLMEELLKLIEKTNYQAKDGYIFVYLEWQLTDKWSGDGVSILLPCTREEAESLWKLAGAEYEL